MKKTLALIALAVLSVTLIAANAATTAKKWEYTSFSDAFYSGNVDKALNKLGEERWELVSVTVQTKESQGTIYAYFLKREKAE